MGAQPSLPDNAASFCELSLEVSLHECPAVVIATSHIYGGAPAPLLPPRRALSPRRESSRAWKGRAARAARAKNNDKDMATGTVMGRTVAAMQIGPPISLRAVCRPALANSFPRHRYLRTRMTVGRLKHWLTFLACRPRVKVACQTENIDETFRPNLGPEQDNFCWLFSPTPLSVRPLRSKYAGWAAQIPLHLWGMGPKQVVIFNCVVLL